MVDASTGESGGLGPDEAFRLLANDTRVAILFTLWERYDPWGDDNAVPFSELREMVGMRDPGQFHYHLDQLADHFVRRTETGYELRQAGHRLVQTVIAGTGIEDPTLAPAEIPETCPFCGAPIAISYADETLYLQCTACEGGWPERAELPRGTLSYHEFEPAGLGGRTPEEVLQADLIHSKHDRAMMVEGVCPVCTGRVDASLSFCENHDMSEAACPECGWIRRPVGQTCAVCKFRWLHTAGQAIATHPAVIGFHYERGISFDIANFEHYVRVLEWEEDLVSEEPLELRVTVPVDGDELQLTLDERVEVIDIDGP